jgi:hypothetical protein
VFVAEGVGEDELSVFSGFEGDFVDGAGEQEKEVFREEEVY